MLKICDDNPQFADFLRNRCIKRDGYWKCYEIARAEIDDKNFQYSGQKDMKQEMAQKFFENLNINEIKAMLKLKYDPRFTSITQKAQIQKDLNSCLVNKRHDEFVTQLSYKILPNIDYMVQDAYAVCVMTKHLWKIVSAHIELFYDIVLTHNVNDGKSVLETMKSLLLQFKIE